MNKVRNFKRRQRGPEVEDRRGFHPSQTTLAVNPKSVDWTAVARSERLFQ